MAEPFLRYARSVNATFRLDFNLTDNADFFAKWRVSEIQQVTSFFQTFLSIILKCLCPRKMSEWNAVLLRMVSCSAGYVTNLVMRTLSRYEEHTVITNQLRLRRIQRCFQRSGRSEYRISWYESCWGLNWKISQPINWILWRIQGGFGGLSRTPLWLTH